MEINFKLFRQEDLLEGNASYSLGWIEILDGAKEINLFKDNFCMVFITGSCLADYIQHLAEKKVKKIRWVGEDHGGTFILSVENSELCIQDEDSKILLDFQRFQSSLIEGINSFLEYCLQVNPNINEESAFIDLQASFQALRS
jgi:hypothetical protein